MMILFDQRFVWTGVALAAVTALSFFLARPQQQPEIVPMTESVSGIERNAEIKPQEEYDYAYILKEHDGKVAVYPAGADEPELILDVLVKYLPDYDRSQMIEGIHVKTYDELVSLLEDYTS